MANVNNPADGTFVVVEGQRRVTGPQTKEQAEAEANKRNQLMEAQGQPVPESRRARVVQNLMG
jgi:hypothetical protein